LSPQPPAPRGSWPNAAAVTVDVQRRSGEPALRGHAESRQCYRPRCWQLLTERQGRVAFLQLARPVGRSLRGVPILPIAQEQSMKSEARSTK
jgi:hypothetical protein